MDLAKSFACLGLTFLLVLSQLSFGFCCFSGGQPKALVFLAYSPYWFQYFKGNNWTQVARDLELIKLMGFDGVRIHYEYVVELGLVERLLECTQRLGLKVIWATHATYWNNKFPTRDFPNETIVQSYKAELRIIANASSKYSHVLYISVFYPIPFPAVAGITYEECLQRISSADFNDAIKDIVAYVKSFGVKCTVESEGIPRDFPVKFIENADGYGIQPFSTRKDDIDAQHILDYAAYFEKSGKEVFIGEYGFRTWKPAHHWDFGMVSCEATKAELIKQYFEFASSRFEIITYFAMYDGDGGWGLVNDDGTLRLSGWSASQWLHSREKMFETERAFNHLVIGVIVEAVAIVIIATFTAVTYKRTMNPSTHNSRMMRIILGSFYVNRLLGIRLDILCP
ncbi:MAG: hypothetical protein QXL77_04840 [Candidatus Bathyarchaeia archaeon]